MDTNRYAYSYPIHSGQSLECNSYEAFQDSALKKKKLLFIICLKYVFHKIQRAIMLRGRAIK